MKSVLLSLDKPFKAYRNCFVIFGGNKWREGRGRRMKEMIDSEARNAHVDSPSQVMGNTFPIRK